MMSASFLAVQARSALAVVAQSRQISSISLRHLSSSRESRAQVQDNVAHDSQGDPDPNRSPTEPQKLGKRARKALKARQRQEDERIAREAKALAKAEGQARRASTTVPQESSDPPPIVKVKHMFQESNTPGAGGTTIAEASGTKKPAQGVDDAKADRTAGFSGSLFRSHISSLLSGFGTSPATRPLEEDSTSPAGRAASSETSAKVEEANNPTPSSEQTKAEAAEALAQHKNRVNMPGMTKYEKMESQARVIFQAIRDARERGIVDEDESFFYPYPEGVPPKDMEGRDAVWLNLGPDPESWGRDIPPVKDQWLEVLSLGLTKEISGRPFGDPVKRAEPDEAEGLEDATQGFDDLVEDYDLEDHERLEQLGDSVVNMSSRLLAYLSYPDVNEGSLTRLSNYPTQNNFLALLFQECGLAARRDELRRELRRARLGPDADLGDSDEKNNTKNRAAAAQTDEKKAQIPLLIKRDADMFEAYAAAVFLSHGNDFNVVHDWLCHLFRPFQDQAYRFMVQRSEALARIQANRAAAAASNQSDSSQGKPDANSASSNLAAQGLGMGSASVDPSSTSFSSLFPGFGKGSEKSAPIPAYALHHSNEAFITDEFLTVAARARRQREERLREELRLQDQQELMKMGWFSKSFLNLRKGFRQYVMGKDVVQEEEARIRQKVDELRGMSEKDRQRLRAKERTAAGVSIRSTGSKTRTKVTGEQKENSVSQD